MEIKITTRNFASNVGVESLVAKELSRVIPMFADDTLFDVCIKKFKDSTNRDSFKCDIMIKNGKQFIRGYAEAETVDLVVDGAVDSLKRKARKIKTLNVRKRKEYGKFMAQSYDMETTDGEIDTPLYSRVKEIKADIFSPEDAIIQMEMSGHNFFVFKDKFGMINVAYKRDQGYGVLMIQ